MRDEIEYLPRQRVSSRLIESTIVEEIEVEVSADEPSKEVIRHSVENISVASLESRDSFASDGGVGRVSYYNLSDPPKRKSKQRHEISYRETDRNTFENNGAGGDGGGDQPVITNLHTVESTSVYAGAPPTPLHSQNESTARDAIEVRIYKQLIQEKEKELDSCRSELEKCRNTAHKRKVSLDILTRDVKQTQKDLAAKTLAYTKLSDECATLQRDIAARDAATTKRSVAAELTRYELHTVTGERDACRADLEAATVAAAERARDLREVRAELEVKRSECEELRGKQQQYQETILHARRELDEMNALSETLRGIQSSVAQLEEEVTERDRKIEMNAMLLEEAEDMLASARLRAEECKKEAIEATEALTLLSKDVVLKNKEYDVLKRQCQKLKEMNTHLQDDVKKKEVEVDQNYVTINEMNNALRAKKVELRALRETAEGTKSKMTKVSEDLETKTKQLQNKENEFAQLEQVVSNLQEQLSSMEQLKEKLCQTETKLSAAKKDAEGANSALKRVIAEMDAKSAKLATKTSECDALERKCKDLQDKVNGQEVEDKFNTLTIEESDKKLARAVAELAVAKKERQVARTNLASVSNELKDMVQKLSSKETENKKLMDEIKRCAQFDQAATKNAHELRESLSNITKEWDEKTQQNLRNEIEKTTRLEQEVSTKDAQLRRALHTIGEKNEELSSAARTLAAQRDDAAQTRLTLAEVSQRLEETSRELETKVAEAHDVEEKYRREKMESERLRRELDDIKELAERIRASKKGAEEEKQEVTAAGYRKEDVVIKKRSRGFELVDEQWQKKQRHTQIFYGAALSLVAAIALRRRQ